MAFLFFILCFFLIRPVFAESIIKITDFSSNSSPEWIQLTNNSPESINISNWYFKDLAGTIKTITNTCISASFTQTFDFTNYLNNDGDTVYLYNNTNELIDTFIYTTGVIKDKPTSTNTCALPTNTPIPTSIPTSTPIPTAAPTSDPTITNPTSGISMTEFMPYSDPEWIEIHNTNDKPVKLVGWKLEDKDGHTRNMGENGVLSISANSYYIFEYSPFFDNNNDEKVIFRRQDNSIVTQVNYGAGLRTIDQSWSSINNNWCQSSITKGYGNVTSCYSAPTPTKISTPTPDQSKFTSSDIATESAIIEPASESSFLSPSPQTTAAPTTGSILGDDISNTTKKNYLPLILIISGGLLLTSPVIISKLKK